MTGGRFILSAQERAVLSDLLSQFTEVLEQGSAASDPALARLAPSVYPDDDESSREFRRLTEADSIARRQADAAVIADALARADHVSGQHPAVIPLDEETAPAWMRGLAALRLVLASRLGIAVGGPEHETVISEPDPNNPVVGIYEWLGYQLEQVVVVSS
ncbi:DUF2017 family protein [Microbacterium sp. ZW T5_56]|uniref:DUF2017 family protein n=1 Tax=Microbacterium sp. ZW T5_56 TaxID=3378081 RepID=UPI00385512D9